MLSRRTIVLKPMQAGLSGYARLQTEGEKTLLTLHARGIKPAEEVRLYHCFGGRAVQEAAAACANAYGEVSTVTESPADADRLQALLVISTSGDPRPLLIGLLNGSLPDAKNAALALCERLKQKPKAQAEGSSDQVKRKTPKAINPSVNTVLPQAKKVNPRSAADHIPHKKKNVPKPLPREVFLPAIDPAPYAQAAEAERADALLPPPKCTAPAADRLRPLQWPRGFESLKPYFQKALPTALFDMPGWRFVYAAHAGGPGGLWLGVRRLDGRVCSVAYAHRGSASQNGFRPIRGLDGQPYSIMIQNF